jgi:hypothetical protein
VSESLEINRTRQLIRGEYCTSGRLQTPPRFWVVSSFPITVVLAVRSLLNRLKNGDGVSYLRKRLDLLSPDLEDLYKSMLRSIKDIYLEQTS